MSAGMSGAMAETFGSACSAVPADGPGSFAGMAMDPVATAASNNPVLSTLVGAVKSAGLVDTLNTAQDITVFAPANDAFAKVDKATLDAAMADPQGLLTNVLTYHVVAGTLTPQMLAGEHMTLQGGTVDRGGRRPGLHRERLGQGHLRQRPDRQRDRLHHRRGPAAGQLIQTTQINF